MIKRFLRWLIGEKQTVVNLTVHVNGPVVDQTVLEESISAAFLRAKWQGRL